MLALPPAAGLRGEGGSSEEAARAGAGAGERGGRPADPAPEAGEAEGEEMAARSRLRRWARRSSAEVPRVGGSLESCALSTLLRRGGRRPLPAPARGAATGALREAERSGKAAGGVPGSAAAEMAAVRAVCGFACPPCWGARPTGA